MEETRAGYLSEWLFVLFALVGVPLQILGCVVGFQWIRTKSSITAHVIAAFAKASAVYLMLAFFSFPVTLFLKLFAPFKNIDPDLGGHANKWVSYAYLPATIIIAIVLFHVARTKRIESERWSKRGKFVKENAANAYAPSLRD
jgi:hypothetical protein